MSNWSQITWNQRPTGILSNLYLTEDEDKSVMQWLDERETELREQIAQEIKGHAVLFCRYGESINCEEYCDCGKVDNNYKVEFFAAIARGDSK